MGLKGRANDPRRGAEAAIVEALEGSSFRQCDLDKAGAIDAAAIDACLTRLVEQGRVVRIESEREAVYAMSSVGS